MAEVEEKLVAADPVAKDGDVLASPPLSRTSLSLSLSLSLHTHSLLHTLHLDPNGTASVSHDRQFETDNEP
jgi:hypothetical protein